MICFALAVALAQFAGANGATVTVFWPPYRLDLSLNLVVILVVLAFVVAHLVWQSVSALLALPQKAQQWRTLQKDRAMQQALLKAQSYLLAGRYTRAGASARQALGLAADLQKDPRHEVALGTVRALGHLTASRSAHFLRDHKGRDTHLAEAISVAQSSGEPQLKDGALMQAANWALDDQDSAKALDYLTQLSPGAARRTYGLKIRLRADQTAGKVHHALETAKLLVKHKAFSPTASASLLRGLAQQTMRQSHDLGQLAQAWAGLSPEQQAQVDLAVFAAGRNSQLEGPAALTRNWLLPAWERLLGKAVLDATDQQALTRLVTALQSQLEGLEPAWLARIEKAQLAHPQQAELLYLVGVACLERQLWGKAESLLSQAAPLLKEQAMARQAWCALAALAEHRGQAELASEHYKRAALIV